MKSIRILAVVLCCALIFSFNVSADTILLDKYDYIAEDSFGIIYLSTVPLSVYPVSVLSNAAAANNPDRILWNGRSNDNFDMLVLIPYIIGNIVYYTPINIDDNNIPYMILPYDYTYKVDTAEDYYFYGVSGASNPPAYATVSVAISRWYSSYNAIIENYKIISNHNISNATSSGNPSNYRIPLNNITIDEDFNINSALNNDISISELSSIIESVINNQTQTLLQIGNNYNQIDQNIINGLGSAEDQLSNAEDAIQNKSQSLVNKVASQWTANKGVASSFLTTISPATSAIGTVTDNFFEAIPEEIKNAVITIMLIVFIGWLIGRVEG